jgi:putative ABC transport system substrate-binding protein
MVANTEPEYWEDIRVGAEQAGVMASRIDLQSVDDLDTAFEAAAAQHVDAVIVAANPLLLPVSDRLAELALRYRLPGCRLKQDADAGLLMTYGVDLAAVHRRAALYVERLLNGENQADLPVEQQRPSSWSSMPEPPRPLASRSTPRSGRK